MSNYNLKNDLSIEELALPIRTVNALNRAQITTLQQLQMLSVQELTQMRGIGEIGLQILLSTCEKYSIHIPPTPKRSFSHSSFIKLLSHKTIILFQKVNISTLEDIPLHSTEELVQWCEGNVFHAAKIYKELKSAGIATHSSGSPFLFEISSFPAVSVSSLLWHGIYRIDQFLSMNEKELYHVRNLGKKRIDQLLELKKEYSTQPFINSQ